MVCVPNFENPQTFKPWKAPVRAQFREATCRAGRVCLPGFKYQGYRVQSNLHFCRTPFKTQHQCGKPETALSPQHCSRATYSKATSSARGKSRMEHCRALEELHTSWGPWRCGGPQVIRTRASGHRIRPFHKKPHC